MNESEEIGEIKTSSSTFTCCKDSRPWPTLRHPADVRYTIPLPNPTIPLPTPGHIEAAANVLCTCVCVALLLLLLSWITHAHFVPLFITKCLCVHFILNPSHAEYELSSFSTRAGLNSCPSACKSKVLISRPPQHTLFTLFFIPAIFEEKAGISLYPTSARPSVRPSIMSHHCS